MKINKELDKLWFSIINNFDINLSNHTIEMDVSRVDGCTKNNYHLKISGVTSFYYHNPGSYFNDDIASTEEWEYAELSEVVCDDKLYRVYVKPEDILEPDKEFFVPNIVMEIWNCKLLIKAKAIEINNDEYKLM
ncbi:MAG: hypothetical protein H0Z33_15435 [Bacillaceae bacterium]|nr:hypothetical protein [Bacillaceae bacterium]